ncbi:MAG: formylglycine-generating enzyme family protein [Myxococcota bacterium]
MDGPLEAVLARALAPRPDRRDVTAREIAGALAASRPWSPRRWPLLAVLAAIAGAALLARPSPAPYADVLVPGGTVTLGDPAGAYPLEPRRTVEIAPFRLGAGEVHQALWREVTGIDPSSHRVFDGGLGMYCTTYAGVDYVGDDLPVVCVDLAGVARFANALSERHGLDPAYTIEEVAGEEAPLVRWDRGANGWRLPTGDEWEHAARAGRTGRIEVDDSADLCAWQNGRDLAFLRLSPRTDDALGCDDGYAGPAPVGAFPPNAWGLRSMTGNVAEWVWDPAGRQRGTSFEGGEEHLRLSFTMSRPPETRALGIGFRLARAP